MVSVTVQIVQWGKTAMTERSIRSVLRSDFSGELDIILYDNNSPDGPGNLVEDDRVQVVLGDENIGFGPAHNKIAALAQGDLLIILNNDTVLDRSAIARLVERYEETSAVGAVTPQYRDFDGSILEMGGYLGADGSGWQLFRSGHPPASFLQQPYRADYGSGACLLVSRDDFLSHGGFDDLYAPAYYEDADLCLKLGQMGRSTVVEPSAIVYHYEGATSGRDIKTGPKRYQARNRSRFVQRWSDTLKDQPVVTFASAIATAMSPQDPLKKRILFIAPHLAKPDRDAGSGRMLSMLTAIVDRGHAVAFWCEHTGDAPRYAPLLEEAGIHWFGPPSPERWWVPEPVNVTPASVHELLELGVWDGVIIAWHSAAEQFAPFVRQILPDVPLIIDAVDLHFLREERAADVGASVDGAVGRDRELSTYAQATGVITASPVESDVLTSLIPGLPIHSFLAVAGIEAQAQRDDSERDQLLFLGSANHPPNLDAIDYWIESLADPIAERLGRRVPLRVVGNGFEAMSDEWLERAGDRVVMAGWIPDLEPEFMATRAFFAPLRYGAGTKGKILTGVAHKVPIITTSIGAEGNESFVRDSLIVVDETNDLIDAAVHMLTNDEAWEDRRQTVAKAAEQLLSSTRAAQAVFVDWVERRLDKDEK